MEHIPVMADEAIKYLNIKKNGTYIDCTFGGGGHSLGIIKNLSSKGKLLALDWDSETEKLFTENFSSYKNAKFVCSNFAEVSKVVSEYNIKKIDGVLFDFGFSSLQIDNYNRGFSFNFDAPLDMRYSVNNSLTAAQIVNTYDEKKLAKIFLDFADERFAEKIAKAIVAFRFQKKISKTLELVEIIRHSTPYWYHRQKIHFATKTFQALRIAVNNEIENIEKGILSAINLVSAGSRIVVISFHSIEHRLLKNIFKEAAKNNSIKLVEKKPIFPLAFEIAKNPRSRSAQLRVVEKI
ncbi:MAG: 16S rRNA (cytosine(1402)-N(4))-methyltransferase [Elusimicrobia bacterium HGW-Elusimicrobia-4]|nr:MAG: 16S rRNA (cytosine(1402)-N(4))-methyltransferase [Elusimicrobia bacterium HGW-Elusimicrobia-4]